MTLDEYRAMVRAISDALHAATLVVGKYDLHGLRAQLEHADSVGPILDPTAWRDANASGLLESQSVLLAWAEQTRAAGEHMTTFAFELYLRHASTLCSRCGLKASAHGHGETGRDDSHPFEPTTK